MKLQKVLVVLGLSVCILSTQMHVTFGIEDEAMENAESVKDDAEEKLKAEEPKTEEAKVEKPKVEEPKAETPKAESPKAEESKTEEPKTEEPKKETAGESEAQSQPEVSDEPGTTDTPGQPATPGESDTPGQPTTPGESDTPDQPMTPGESDTPGQPTTPGESEIPDQPTTPGESDTPGQPTTPGESDTPDQPTIPGESDTPGQPTTPGESEIPDQPTTPEETENFGKAEGSRIPKTLQKSKASKSVTSNRGLLDRGDSQKNAFANFKPSSNFVDNREKVKYNLEVPIEGLPSFITQEMIVGALKCQDETGYPASVTIAQIIQESGFGKYGPGGEQGQGLSYLAYQYNNLFGIKGTGTAGSVAMNTGEQRSNGTRYRITAGFRVYHTYTECIEDRTQLLKRVYSDLTFGVKDANTFAVKIGKRWATSLSYSQNLISQMRRYDLYRLDSMTLMEFSNLLGIFADPCPGAKLTSSFGRRNAPIAGASTYHKGVDLGTGAYNIPTYAAAAGTVTYAGPCGSAGNLVTIDHGNGMMTKYMHHDKVYVEVGEKVEKGQQIGLSGTTGNSTGNHLHFQVEKNGVAIDPMPYLNALKGNN